MNQTCLRCGHIWQARIADPRQCPHCKTPRWNEPAWQNTQPQLNEIEFSELMRRAVMVDQTLSEYISNVLRKHLTTKEQG